jgi:nucleoside 2-deoxyribosyltransferase
VSDTAAGKAETIGATAVQPNCMLCGDEGIDAQEIATPDDGVIDCIRCGHYRLTSDVSALLEHAHADGRSQVGGAESDAVHRSGQVSPRERTGDPTKDFPLDELHRVSAYAREVAIHRLAPPTITLEGARAMADAGPRSVTGRLDRLLQNLGAASEYAGRRLELNFHHDRTMSWSGNGGETAFLAGSLRDAGLVDWQPGSYGVLTVTGRGWSRVEELSRATTSYTQAFVAMSFDDTLVDVYREGIAPAIRDAGYDPFILSTFEHADQVDDLIILELNRSRFVVADFTQQRQSVYFEAGYALGRGLPVIWTCREDDYAAAHFDTRQYNHIVWSDVHELRERLYRRIKVVVG